MNNGEEKFGEIGMFVECSSLGTLALVKTFTKTQSNILTSSGSPCYPILEAHACTGLISEFIVEVLPLCSSSVTTAILVSTIISNCIMVEPSTSFNGARYVVKMPNNYEHH